MLAAHCAMKTWDGHLWWSRRVRHRAADTYAPQEAHAMIDTPRLRQLLDELHESHATPEEVCRSCPELLPEVRARWREVCLVRAELDALFPVPTVRGVGAPA